MRRHFESKHSDKKLNLPKEENRHGCPCGRTFLEPNRLQEHMIAANHGNQNGKSKNKEKKRKMSDDVIDWKDMVD